MQKKNFFNFKLDNLLRCPNRASAIEGNKEEFCLKKVRSEWSAGRHQRNFHMQAIPAPCKLSTRASGRWLLGTVGSCAQRPWLLRRILKARRAAPRIGAHTQPSSGPGLTRDRRGLEDEGRSAEGRSQVKVTAG